MKKLRRVCVAIAMILMAIFTLSGCMVTQPQRMRNVKGTYYLKSYTRTDGKTGNVTNYLEKYGLEVYLIVTGESTGYYVYSDNETEPYKRSVSLRYVYDEEKPNKVSQVEYSYDGKDYEHFGVTRGALNYSLPRVYISDLVNSDGYNKNWERVDRATDLSYVNTRFSNIADYVAPEDSANLV